MGDVQRLLSELWEDVAQSLGGYLKLDSDGFVAEAQGFVYQLTQVGHVDQSIGQAKLGIEQVDARVLLMEVEIENAEVEQQLHVVFLYDLVAVAVVEVTFNKVVTSRFLFDEQFEVCGHEVDTSLQSELLTDEGWFHDGFLHVVVASQFVDDVFEVVRLPCGIVFELHCIKVGASHIFECFLPETALE